MKINEIASQLDPPAISNSLTVNPACNPDLLGVASVEEAVTGTLSYIEGPKFAAMVSKTAASALILPLDESLQQQASQRELAWLATADPRLAFAQAIALFYQPFRPPAGLHPTAVIDPSAQLGREVSVGAYAVIGAGVSLGDRACIHPHVTLYPHVSIGDRTVLHANCTIHERSQIGADCVIHSGAVIGAEGFGFVPTPQGWYKMEQSGYTVLEDGVEVGCNTTIDRPAVGVTRIGRDTKLDNLVHIGHGCQVGQNCALAGQVGLAGGVKVGDRVILAGQVGIANQAKIGDGAIATAQSGIHNDISPGEIVSGSPAIANKLFLKISAITKRLPEMYQAFKRQEAIGKRQ